MISCPCGDTNVFHTTTGPRHARGFMCNTAHIYSTAESLGCARLFVAANLRPLPGCMSLDQKHDDHEYHDSSSCSANTNPDFCSIQQFRFVSRGQIIWKSECD